MYDKILKILSLLINTIENIQSMNLNEWLVLQNLLNKIYSPKMGRRFLQDSRKGSTGIPPSGNNLSMVRLKQTIIENDVKYCTGICSKSEQSLKAEHMLQHVLSYSYQFFFTLIIKDD